MILPKLLRQNASFRPIKCVLHPPQSMIQPEEILPGLLVLFSLFPVVGRRSKTFVYRKRSSKQFKTHPRELRRRSTYILHKIIPKVARSRSQMTLTRSLPFALFGAENALVTDVGLHHWPTVEGLPTSWFPLFQQASTNLANRQPEPLVVVELMPLCPRCLRGWRFHPRFVLASLPSPG